MASRRRGRPKRSTGNRIVNKASSKFRSKPRLGSALIIASGIIAIISSIVIGYLAFANAPIFSLADFGIGAIVGVAVLASGFNVYTLDKKKSETWAVGALILYLIEIPALWGFGVGFLIALAGAIISLRHEH